MTNIDINDFIASTILWNLFSKNLVQDLWAASIWAYDPFLYPFPLACERSLKKNMQGLGDNPPQTDPRGTPETNVAVENQHF